MQNREALQILDQAVGRLPLNRAGHVLLQKAMQTLQSFVDKHDPLPEPPNVNPNEGPGKKKK